MNTNLNPVFRAALAPFMPQGVINALRVVDQHRPIAAIRGDTTDITFMGFDLVVETDYMGYIEGVMNAKDGTDCMSMFQSWALTEMKTLVKAAQMDRGL